MALTTSKKLAGQVATVFNGYSFIGMPLISRLGKEGCNIVSAYRGSGYAESKMRVCGGLGQMQFAHYHLKDEDSLRQAMEMSDIVVNLVGKLQETRNFSFDQVHNEGARRMARIARECGVKKFIHFSHINAQPNPEPIVLKRPSGFLTSKYYGEIAVREEFPEAVIFRPSDICGERDNFIVHWTALMRARYTHVCYIWDYYYQCQKQPVWQKDVVDGIMRAIEDDSLNGKTIQAVGPHRYDFYELIEYIRSCGGQGQKYDAHDIKNLRYDPIMRLAITLASFLQKNPFLNWERIELDSHSDRIDPKLPTLKDIGVEPTNVEPHIEKLAFFRPRFHRVEIPYQSHVKIDIPRHLETAV